MKKIVFFYILKSVLLFVVISALILLQLKYSIEIIYILLILYLYISISFIFDILRGEKLLE